MVLRSLGRISSVGLLFLLLGAGLSLSAENLRVAYPSMSSSVFYLIIAQKEGYFREEGLNVEILSIRGEIAKFMRASLKGLNFLVTKREPTIKYMMEALGLKDRELASAIYDAEVQLILRDGSPTTRCCKPLSTT